MRVSSIHVRALCEAAEAAGVSSSVLLSGAALEDLQRGYTWLELAELDRLVARAVELTQDPAFGLHWGARSPMMQLDLITSLAAHSPQLRTCLETLTRFQRLLAEEPEVDLIEASDTAFLRIHPLPTSALVMRVRSELIIAGMLRLLRHFGVPNRALRLISLAYPAPAYASEYGRLLDVPVRFEQPQTAIELDRTQLERSHPLHNVELFALLEEQAERVLARVNQRLTFSERVKNELRRGDFQDQQMSQIARALGVSERSLRRRLADEGSSFSSLAEASQSELARQLLEQPSRSIKEVACQLGFSDVSGFTRAFKRWTGRSPAQFRRRALLPGS